MQTFSTLFQNKATIFEMTFAVFWLIAASFADALLIFCTLRSKFVDSTVAVLKAERLLETHFSEIFFILVNRIHLHFRSLEKSPDNQVISSRTCCQWHLFDAGSGKCGSGFVT